MPSKKRKTTSSKNPGRNGQSSSQALSGPSRNGKVDEPRSFPFLLLPNEVQARIVAFAISNARWPDTFQPSSRSVGNILCVSSRFHTLGIPQLYSSLLCKDHGLETLLDTLQNHPEYAQYVRELVPNQPQRPPWLNKYNSEDAWPIRLVTDIADVLYDAIRSFSNPERKLDLLRLRFPADWMPEALRILRNLQPLHLDWQGGQGHDVGISSLASAVAKGLDDGWLARLVTLNLSGFEFNIETARLLAKQSRLRTLLLVGCQLGNPYSGVPSADEIPSMIIALLTPGDNSFSLSKITIADCDQVTRRAVHQQIGVCIHVTDNEEIKSGAYKLHHEHQHPPPTWHGCQRFVDSQPSTSSIVCPRCCVLSGQTPIGEAVNKMTMAEEPQTDLTARYGLCNQHYDEIFGEAGSSDVAEEEKRLLRRRALECMRWWVDNDDKKFERRHAIHR